MNQSDPNPDTPASIRDATLADLDAIIEIDKQVSGMEKPQYWRDTLDEYTGFQDRRIFLVAEYNLRIIGFILGEIRAWEFGSASCGWVFAIGVLQDDKLHGVGSKLLNELCERFRRVGITTVRTMVVRQNHDLLAFFRSQGMMAGPYQQLEFELSE